MTGEERFQELYRKYGKLVLKMAYSKVQDYHEAQDICQDTFLKMFRSLDLSRPDEDIKYWLLTVSANSARDVLKKGGKYAGKSVSLEQESRALNGSGTGGAGFLDGILKKELCGRILEELRAVSAEQYEIVYYVCCLQMSIGEAAGRLGISYEKASMRLHRARTWVRVNYGEEYKELKY